MKMNYGIITEFPNSLFIRRKRQEIERMLVIFASAVTHASIRHGKQQNVLYVEFIAVCHSLYIFIRDKIQPNNLQKKIHNSQQKKR